MPEREILKQELMRDGFVILRNMIPPDELEELRGSVDVILEKAAPHTRVISTDYVDQQTANVVEFFFDDRFFDVSRKLMDSIDAAPIGLLILSAASTGWHRDLHPIDMAPLDGLQEDIRLNGPPYLQWNVALEDDSFFHVVTGSHLRRNNEHENKIERRDGVVPLPGMKCVELKAGDGVVYINAILHSAVPSGDTKRRTLIFGYLAFGGQAFTHFYPNATSGTQYVELLSSDAADRCRYFEELHFQRIEEVAFVLRSILEKNEKDFASGLDRIHPSPLARMTTIVVLSKAAYLVRKFKNSNDPDDAHVEVLKPLSGKFTKDELDQIWCRFAVLDRKLRSEEKQYIPLFQSGPMDYYFNEMPDWEVTDFIASWG